MRSFCRLAIVVSLAAPLAAVAAAPPASAGSTTAPVTSASGSAAPAPVAASAPGSASVSAAPPATASVQPQAAVPSAPAVRRVALETTQGTIVLELYPEKAPITVDNFLRYVRARYYNGTVFHRVIPGFMVQGGGFTKDLLEKPTRAPIKNEANNGLRNTRGSVAMARTSQIDSATAQFFVNVADNDFLDYQGPQQYGYAVFGKVIDGMGLVDAMVRDERLCPSDSKDPCTAPLPPNLRDVPRSPVMIVKAYEVK